ncbi:sirohydrochlorin chelatase [Mycolicibacterium sp. CBM1]
MSHDLILVAHGTRSPQGLATITEIASAVAAHVGPVRTAFVDVLGPNPREVLADSSRPAIVVPAFLAAGYHVNADLPARIRESGHSQVTVTPALGPDPMLARVLHARLADAGWTAGDAVVLAAAGSSDPQARAEVAQAAALLADLVGEVTVGFVATGTPTAAEEVHRLKRSGRRVFVASYLLAPGVFHTRLGQSGADGVTSPLGAHPDLIRLLADRFGVPAMSSRIH